MTGNSLLAAHARKTAHVTKVIPPVLSLDMTPATV